MMTAAAAVYLVLIAGKVRGWVEAPWWFLLLPAALAGTTLLAMLVTEGMQP